jgi:hypothetical protein
VKALLILNEVSVIWRWVLGSTSSGIIEVIWSYCKFMPSRCTFTIHSVCTWGLIFGWVRIEISIDTIININATILILSLKTWFFIKTILEINSVLSHILWLLTCTPLSVLLLVLIQISYLPIVLILIRLLLLL